MTYQDRPDARRARLERAAARQSREAEARREAADRVVEAIPFGQPVLVGHHSEGRHRRSLERADQNMRKSFERSERAPVSNSKSKIFAVRSWTL